MIGPRCAHTFVVLSPDGDIDIMSMNEQVGETFKARVLAWCRLDNGSSGVSPGREREAEREGGAGLL